MKYQKEDLSYFPYQIDYALKNYSPHHLKARDFRNVITGGLGGSGISGRFIRSFFQDRASLSIEVVSDYSLPAYADKHTLVFLSSYSGNTEETLSMFNDAVSKGCKVIVLSSGGTLMERAEEKKFPVYRAEPGFQPRMALGYPLTYLVIALGELFGIDFHSELHEVSLVLKDTENFIEKAKSIFEKIPGKKDNKVVCVTDQWLEASTIRFCQQLQENAKMEAFYHTLPEANHNVIESYYGKLSTSFFFFNSHKNPRVSLRFEFLKDLLKKQGNTVTELRPKDNSLLALLEQVYVLDWISLLYADHREINSLEIRNIHDLKGVLKESREKEDSNYDS